MRFNITLTPTGKHRMLPIDYQYFAGAWIYRVIADADREFATFLHAEGYRDGNKSFKLFSYSPLALGEYKLWKEKVLFELLTDRVSLKVGFHLNEAAEKFIFGLFGHQQFYLGDRFNGIDFSVTQIERLPRGDTPAVNPTADHRPVTLQYRAASPVVFSARNETGPYARYLSPDEEGYGERVEQHLFQKYSTVPGATPLPAGTQVGFSYRGTSRSKLVTVKAATPQQSKVRGFLYDFTLTAPAELHQLVLNAGLGEKNAAGFGWVERLMED